MTDEAYPDRHRAVRPTDYPTSEALRHGEPWPDQPPFCTACGEELLTIGYLEDDGEVDWHCDGGLNP